MQHHIHYVILIVKVQLQHFVHEQSDYLIEAKALQLKMKDNPMGQFEKNEKKTNKKINK